MKRVAMKFDHVDVRGGRKDTSHSDEILLRRSFLSRNGEKEGKCNVGEKNCGRRAHKESEIATAGREKLAKKANLGKAQFLKNIGIYPIGDIGRGWNKEGGGQ